MSSRDGVGGLLAARQFSELIKQLDAALSEAGGDRQQLLINRAFAYQELGLFRKALKDYEAVLEGEPGHPLALLHKAKVLVALKMGEEAPACLAELASTASLSGPLPVLLEGQLLAAALKSGVVPDGTKLPLLPALAPPAPPPAPAPAAAPSAAAAKPGFAPGFLSGPAAAKAQQVEEQAEAAAAAQAASPAAAGEAAQAAAAAAAAASPGSPKRKPSTPQRAANGAAAAASSSSSSTPSQLGGSQGRRRSPAGPSSALASSRGASGLQPDVPIDPLHQLVARTDANQGVALAVNMVNTGSCREAVALLDLLISHHPTNMGAFAARGTAKALLHRLQEAVDDFSAAIELEPRFHDFYKRRGQALAALGDDEGASRDLRRAIELSADDATKAETHEELGRLLQKQKDYRRAQAEFQVALSLSGSAAGPELLSALGLCQVSQGDLQDGIATYEKALKLDPDNKDLWLNLGMALKEICWVEQAEKALRRAAKLSGDTGGTAVHAYRLLAQMKQGLGDHLGAVKELNRGIQASDRESQRIELRFLRGACHHAVGQHKSAVDDYQQTLEAQGALNPGSSSDLVQFVCLAFYQKEMALYVRDRLDRHVLDFCLDADMHPEFKELWCKKGPPSAEFVAMYRHIMQPQHPNWTKVKPSPPPKAQLLPLLEAADAVGKLVQYTHQGFLPNQRQQRMAGLAAIEFAQALQQLVADRRAGKPTLVRDVGASISARARRSSSSPSGTKGSHAFGWRDAMDIIVRWRQLAEPNDQVIWVDLLTEKEFSAGFGSHTPMFTGQTKCVRYYMVFGRALALMKQVLAAEGAAVDANNKPVPLDTEARRTAAQAAQTAQDMWQALGTDSWVVVPIESSTRPGHKLEGTRLTMVNLSKQPAAAAEAGVLAEDGGAVLRLGNGVTAQGGADAPAPAAKPKPQPDSYEFSIRTPVTPARWVDYDEELAGMFDRLVGCLAEGDKAGAAEAALRFAYYWYNFMPLARGSAFCGYVSMLGAFMAMGAPVQSKMPASYQTDWEAILESSPERFLASVSGWMYPPELQQGPQQGPQQAQHGAAQQQEGQQSAGPAAGAQHAQQQQARGQQQGQQRASAGGSGSSGSQGSCGGTAGAGKAAAAPCKPVEQLPKVIEVLSTMRARLEALNGPEAARI